MKIVRLVVIAYFRLVELKGLNIGIVSLGWLGEKLAQHLSDKESEVWGTVSSEEKSNRINENTKIEALVWNSADVISDQLKSKLSSTDVLILNLPPSVFQNQTYAKGLSQFTPFLRETTKVIFTSSTSVYPNHLNDAVETYVFQHDEINKIHEAELALTEKLKKNLTVLRLSGLIGEDRHPVYYLAKKEMNDYPNKPVNLIHRQDIIQVIEKLIWHDYFGEILNVCHPEHPTRKEYYSKKAKQLNLPTPHFTQSVLNEDHKVVNCEKLMINLKYNTFVPL